jgi:hypothetical protein
MAPRKTLKARRRQKTTADGSRIDNDNDNQAWLRHEYKGPQQGNYCLQSFNDSCMKLLRDRADRVHSNIKGLFIATCHAGSVLRLEATQDKAILIRAFIRYTKRFENQEGNEIQLNSLPVSLSFIFHHC